MIKTHHVYVLYHIENSNEIIRYVGKSSRIKGRFSDHVDASKRGVDTHLYRWIRKIGHENLRIRAVKTFTCEKECFAFEKYLISELKKDGLLCNQTGGGEGASGMKHTEETRKKMSIAKSGANNHMYNANISEDWKQSLKESCNNPETRKKQSLAKIGTKLSDSHKHAISASHLGILHKNQAKNKLKEIHSNPEFKERHRQATIKNMIAKAMKKEIDDPDVIETFRKRMNSPLELKRKMLQPRLAAAIAGCHV